MEESITKAVEPNPQHHESLPLTSSHQPPALPSTFTKVDNNLTGIGFFTASSKRSRKAIEKTTVVIDQGVERRISILPSAKYGLPITQDQDFWLALMQLVEERRRQAGSLNNPFVFTTAELLKILGQSDAGKNYKAVEEWLAVMASTTIEGGAYNTVQKTWMTKRTHAVETTITVGQELPEGRLAEKNHIWFSQWQLDNINAGNLIAIELNTYTQLENNISKNLVPHLQEWLYASQRDGRFEKQYEDVCQLLGTRVYRYRSQIEEQFSPSLNELTTHGYLAKWAIEKMADRTHYKLVIWHGPKYHSDRQTRIEKKSRFEPLPAGESSTGVHRPRQRRLKLTPAAEPTPAVVIDYRVIAELAKRGVGEADARKLMAALPPGQPVLEQLEWGDYQIAQGRGKITNPPGFYISLLQRNVPVPSTFETSQTRKAREQAELEQAQAIQQQRETALAAEEAERTALDNQIAALTSEARQELYDTAAADFYTQYPHLAAIAKANPESAIHDGTIQGRMRNFITSGWKPQQAINQPERQATDLQELPPVPEPAVTVTPVLNLEAVFTTLLLPAPKQPAPEPASPDLDTSLL